MRFAGSLVVVLAVACAALGLRGARAQIDELALRLGEQAMTFPGGEPDEPRVVQLNGVELSFRTREVAAPLSDVLAFYEAACLGSSEREAPLAALLSTIATRSKREEREGYVACVVPIARTLEDLGFRLARFVRTSNLAHLGRLQYAYARTADPAHPGRTFLFSLWSHSTLRLADLIPVGDADAPGSDPPGIPRPPLAQRVLSATELASPSSVYVYLVRSGSPASMELSYREKLAATGWTIVQRVPGESITVDEQRILAARSGNRLLTIVASEKEPSGSVVTLLDWRGSS